ncbi:unnamed protein product [Paramecium sonneborni]|uniref:Uncharacterized protein n=1 Tax=Paramecium sonneborni TaxID=65129 RepID=A0A8S1KBR5_9CILI|nr:unnamed protein product [Paramecium sonneborni]
MSNLNENNRKLVKTKQRWETLTQNITKNKNKESNQIGLKHQIVKSNQKNKQVIAFEKRIQLPSRTINQYLKISKTKICSNLKLQDSKGFVREFRCYDDKSLNIPNYFNQTIAHSLDNDCQSDDEQVQLAVDKLKYLLETQLNQYQKSF